MKVLVTGSLGFLGHHVAMQLLARGFEVIGVDRVEGAQSPKEERIVAQRGSGIRQVLTDISDLDRCLVLIDTYRPDVILHTAAQYSIRYNTESCRSYVRGNLDAFTYMMEAAKTFDVKRFIYASSTAISDEGKPSGLYGATKAYAEHCAHAYTMRSSMTAVGLRFGPIYGPLSRPDTHVYKALQQYLAGDRVKDHSEFSKAGPYVYVEDAASVMANFVHPRATPPRASVYLAVADDEYCSIVDVLQCAAEIHGDPVRWPIGFQPGRRSEQRPDLLALRLALGYVPSTKLRDGVLSMLKWMNGIP